MVDPEEMLAALRINGSSGLTSALASAVIATGSIESRAETEENPEAARILAKLGNRLLTAAQKLGGSLTLPGVASADTPA